MEILIWGSLGIVLVTTLVFSTQIEFLIPAIAAFIVFLLSFVPGFQNNFFLQAIVWLVLSGAGFLIFRNQLLKLRKKRPDINRSEFKGKTAVVIEAVSETQPGRVRFQGTTWIAQSLDRLEVGESVEILDHEGITLQVTKTEQKRIEQEFDALEDKKED